MRIQCILKRPEGTEIELDGISYHFKPEDASLVEGSPEYLAAAHVAEVESRDHVKRLVAIPEAYELILPADPAAAAEARAVKAAAVAEVANRPAAAPAPAVDVAGMSKMQIVEYANEHLPDARFNLAAPVSTLRKQLAKAIEDKAAADKAAAEEAAAKAAEAAAQ